MFIEKYPNTDFNEFNLDWIIRKILELNKEWNIFKAINTIKYKGVWNVADQYPAWSVVTDGDKGYISLKDVPAGIDINNTEYWLMIINYESMLDELEKTRIKAFNVEDDLIADITLENGMYAMTLGQNDINDGNGMFFRISEDIPLTRYITLANGLYAERISQPLDGQMIMNDDSSKQWIADCCKNWADHSNEIIYEGAANLFFDNTHQVSGKWTLTCSIFAMAVIFGIDFDHSKYNGHTENIPNPNAYKDDYLLELLKNPSGFYSKDILPYLMLKGYAFKPDEKLSNVQTGDVLFFALGNATPENAFMGIDHCAVFGYHNNDVVYTSWEMGGTGGPAEAHYDYDYAATYCKYVVRFPFKQHERKPLENMLAQTTSNPIQASIIQCELNGTVKAGKWYTFICKATNLAGLGVYPALYTSGYARKLVSYDGNYTTRPYNDIYIMPFVHTQDETGYLYPAFVKRITESADAKGDFDWVCLVEGFYSDLDELIPYYVNLGLTNKNISDDISTSHTKGTTFSAVQYGKIINMTFDITLTSNVSAYGVIGTIPAGYRPYSQQMIPGIIDITSSGNIRSLVSKSSGDIISVSFTYIKA